MCKCVCVCVCVNEDICLHVFVCPLMCVYEDVCACVCKPLLIDTVGHQVCLPESFFLQVFLPES